MYTLSELISLTKTFLKLNFSTEFKAELDAVLTDDTINSIEALRYSSYKDLSEDEKAFILQLRTAILNLLNNPMCLTVQHNDLTLHDCLFELVLSLVKLSPQNEFQTSESSSGASRSRWICPISAKKSNECETPFALSTGYVYDKESLFRWFNQCKEYKCTVTRQMLPAYEQQRLIALDNGLQKLAELKKEYVMLHDKLLADQQKRFARFYLSTRKQIKKDFVAVISDGNTASAVKHRLKANINKRYQQLPKLKQPMQNDATNYSNIDLSGICLKVGGDKLYLDFRGANLKNVTFLGSGCIHANFTDANLKHARFLCPPGGYYCIKHSNYTRANLRNANLSGWSNFAEINLTQTDLTGAYLYNEDGILISGPKLKKYFTNHRIEGLETAIFGPELNTETPASTSQTSRATPSTPATATPATAGLFAPTRMQRLQAAIRNLHEPAQPNTQRRKRFCAIM